MCSGLVLLALLVPGRGNQIWVQVSAGGSTGSRSVKLLLIAIWDTIEAFPHGQDGGGSFQDRGLMAGDLKM